MRELRSAELIFTHNTATVQIPQTKHLNTAAQACWLWEAPTQHVGQRSCAGLHLAVVSFCFKNWLTAGAVKTIMTVLYGLVFIFALSCGRSGLKTEE